MDFQKELSRRTAFADRVLEKYMPFMEEADKTKIIADSMNYSLMAGGKRLRPVLMQASFLLFSPEDKPGEGDFSLEDHPVLQRFMAAIEMIHTYSLIHDDLPAMDNDDYRRGKLTNHKVYGEAIAILAGDGLLNYAYETAAKTLTEVNLCSPEVNRDACRHVCECSRALQVLMHKAGIYGMIGGQVMDIEAEGKKLSLTELDELNGKKTGALLEASMMIGAILGGATEQETEEIQKIAHAVGLAFQIQDDILDITSTTEVLGKPVHSDEKNDKYTYVAVCGLEEAKRKVRFYSDEACEMLQKMGREDEFLRQCILYLINRTS